jgi:hypothetical protein
VQVTKNRNRFSSTFDAAVYVLENSIHAAEDANISKKMFAIAQD